MRQFEFHTIDVFTTQVFGGNPLAIFPYASGLSDAEMQAIAAEINYSETTFVLPPQNPAHTACVRIFTPKSELPFAGHPNVGTGFLLARHPEMMPNRGHDNKLVFEEIAGLVQVVPQIDNSGIIGSSITAPEPFHIGATVPVDVVAACASLEINAIRTSRTKPVFGSTGIPVVLAEVTSRDALRAAAPSVAAFTAANNANPDGDDGFILLLFCVDGSGVIHTRMFAPLAGITEDPATGGAATALAGLLTKLDPAASNTTHFEIHQGVDMGRPSQISVTTNIVNGVVQAPVLSGSCVEVMHGVFHI